MQRKLWMAFTLASFLALGCGDRVEAELICDDNIDNDGDGAGDCADLLDCSNEPQCKEEICNNGINDNEDPLVDCLDPDCAGDSACVEVNCGDQSDNDNDGDTDCDDSDCDANIVCACGNGNIDAGEDCDGANLNGESCTTVPGGFTGGALACDANCNFNTQQCQGGTPEDCDNDIDDDNDGDVDCADSECAQGLGCAIEEGNCADGIDNDGNNFTDCDDFDCTSDPACGASPEICTGGIDEDLDSFIDCNDFDCNADPACGGSAEVCTGGLDEDGDSFIDCNDFDCQNDPACAEADETVCTDTQDNDGDGFTDCIDRGCDVAATCIALEVCNDQTDNDGDGRIDCQDGSCVNNAACNAGAVQIQQIQNGSIASGNVILNNVFVTGVRKANNNNLNLMVQEPQDETIAGVTYPRFAGVQLFMNAATATALAVPADLQVNDCISIAGTVAEFNAGTQINAITSFTRNPVAQCGTAPQAFVITVPPIATDTDGATAGNQNGVDSEAFEFVLLKVINFNITTSPDAGGDVNGTQTGGNGEVLNIDNFMFSGDNAIPIPLATNDVCTDITGVYGQFVNNGNTVNKYHLQPRGDADIANCQ